MPCCTLHMFLCILSLDLAEWNAVLVVWYRWSVSSTRSLMKSGSRAELRLIDCLLLPLPRRIMTSRLGRGRILLRRGDEDRIRKGSEQMLMKHPRDKYSQVHAQVHAQVFAQVHAQIKCLEEAGKQRSNQAIKPFPVKSSQLRSLRSKAHRTLI